MPGQIWKDSHEAWQTRVVLLLKRRYGPTQFIEIPDRDRGDGGLEGFARDGSAYQCYAAVEPLTTEMLYRSQRNKITKDLNKFKNNHEILVKILGPTKISRWILVVPRWESKDLLVHAEKKAEEVRNVKLPYVTNDFCVHIATEDDFAVERQNLLNVGVAQIRIDPEEIQNKKFEDWTGQYDTLAKNLDTKIVKLRPNSDRNTQLQLRSQFIKHFLVGQNILEKLHSEYPELYTEVKQQKEERQIFLETSSMIPSGTPAEMFNKALTQFHEELTRKIKGLESHTIERLVYEAISDWLLRCPLDFPLTEN